MGGGGGNSGELIGSIAKNIWKSLIHQRNVNISCDSTSELRILQRFVILNTRTFMQAFPLMGIAEQICMIKLKWPDVHVCILYSKDFARGDLCLSRWFTVDLSHWISFYMFFGAFDPIDCIELPTL